MTTNNETFKAYLNKFKHVTGGLRVYSELNEHEKSIAKDAWQAATTEANKQIAELESEVAELKSELADVTQVAAKVEPLIYERVELQASNNRLQAKLTAEKEYANELLKSSNHLFVENEQLKASNNILIGVLKSAKPIYTTANDAQVKKGYAESGAIKHYTIEANVLHEARSATKKEGC